MFLLMLLAFFLYFNCLILILFFYYVCENNRGIGMISHRNSYTKFGCQMAVFLPTFNLIKSSVNTQYAFIFTKEKDIVIGYSRTRNCGSAAIMA